MSDFYLKVGDRLPKIRSNLKDGTGAPMDLTFATVTFRMGQGAQPKISAPATIIDAANGIVEYAWTPSDVDTGGNYEAEWLVSMGNLTLTVPNSGYMRILITERCSNG